MENCNECSDAKYSSCPPKMSDGRLFTDYRPRCHNFMMNKNSYEQRQLMIHNAEEMLKVERTKVKYCGPCMEPFNVGTMLEEQSVVTCDNNSCKVTLKNPHGLGQGRDYNIDETAHGKFLSDREIENKMVSCCDDKPFKDNNIFMANDTQGRFATPGGGVL